MVNRLQAVMVWMAVLCPAALLLAGGCSRERASPPAPAPAASAERPAADSSARVDSPSTTARAAPAADTASPADTAQAAAPAAGGWTAGITAWTPSPPPRSAVLRAVRTGRHEGFDRTVFEFGSDTLPGYHLEYIDRPVRQCGSGHPVPLAGDGWLEIRFQPAQAHTDAGHPTVEERARTPALPVLRELKLTCDFEGQVTWVLGLAAPNRYRVLRLDDPTRVAIDVQH